MLGQSAYSEAPISAIPTAKTRFYLPLTGTPHVQPTVDGEWDITTNMVRRFMPATKSPTGSASTSNNGPSFAKTDTSIQDIAHAQFVSAPVAAQTISGWAQLATRGGESTGADDAHLQVIVRVISNDGTTVRGTLYAGYTGALTSSIVDGNYQSREFSTATQGRYANMALDAVTALEGDRIVVEVGQRHRNTGATSNGYLTFGDLSTNPDQPFIDDASNATSASATFIEFSNGVFLSQVISDFYSDPGGVAIMTRTIRVPTGVTSSHEGLVAVGVNSEISTTWTPSISGSGSITQVDSIGAITSWFLVYKVTGATAGDAITIASTSSRCVAIVQRYETGVTHGTVSGAVRPGSQATTTSNSVTPAVSQRVLVLAMDRTTTATITAATSSGGEKVQFENYQRIDTVQPAIGIYWGEFVASAAASRTATITVSAAASSGYCAVVLMDTGAPPSTISQGWGILMV